MEPLHIIRVSFDIFSTFFNTFLNSISDSFTLSFIPFFDKLKIYFLDHRAMITGITGFLLVFSIYSMIRMVTRKRVLVPVKKQV
jgi:hypothetical protein